MAKNELDYDDLHDFFERPYEVTSRSNDTWLFTSTSERYNGWTVEFGGEDLGETGDFPATGMIFEVIIRNPEGDVADHADDEDGLPLSAADLAALVEDEEEDEDGEDDHDGSGGDDDLSGDDGDDELDGHGGDDDLTGEDGDDSISGGGGDDELSGDDGDDDLKGEGGDDDIHGGSGDDELSGSGGKDNLFGDDGNDTLKGQGKNDKLDGGLDDDLLIGGGGKDIFIFSAGFGDDVIKRFDHGKDKINLEAFEITEFGERVSIEREHGDTIVTVHDGDTIQGTITIDKVSGGKTVDQGDFQI